MNCEHLCTLCVQCAQVFTRAQIDTIIYIVNRVCVCIKIYAVRHKLGTSHSAALARLALQRCQVWDAIAVDDTDLGQVTQFYHTIDTGDARPIRQPPRRLPFHQRHS